MIGSTKGDARPLAEPDGGSVSTVPRRPRIRASLPPAGPAARSRRERPIGGSSTDVVYSCPMDPDVRSHRAGSCRRCGMALVAGVPEPVEFHIDVSTVSRSARARAARRAAVRRARPVEGPAGRGLQSRSRKALPRVRRESGPGVLRARPPQRWSARGCFQYPITFPKAGMYRVLGDFYPVGGMPQLASETVIVPGEPPSHPRHSVETIRRRRRPTCACRSTPCRNIRSRPRARSCGWTSAAHTRSRNISASGATCSWRAATSST